MSEFWEWYNVKRGAGIPFAEKTNLQVFLTIIGPFLVVLSWVLFGFLAIVIGIVWLGLESNKSSRKRF